MTPTSTATPVLQPEQLAFLLDARATSAVLAACLDLGVLTAWIRDQSTPPPSPGTAGSGRRPCQPC